MTIRTKRHIKARDQAHARGRKRQKVKVESETYLLSHNLQGWSLDSEQQKHTALNPQPLPLTH